MWAVVAAASRRRQGAARARRRRPRALRGLEPGDGRAAARHARNTTATIPHGGDTALMFAARVGDLASAKLLVAAGANVNDADAWGVSATALAAHAGFGDLVEFLLDHGADPNAAAAGFTALHAADHAPRRADGRARCSPTAPTRTRRSRTWTPTRRSSKDCNFNPELVGATPFWLAARFTAAGHHAAARRARRRSALRASRRATTPAIRAAPRTQTTNAVMAAAGMGGGVPWVRSRSSRARGAGARSR